MPYVSITGLRLKSRRHVLRFWWHALRSMRQARAADGLLSVAARNIDGVAHTLSVWRDETAMRAFLTRGPHLSAMRAFREIATGKTIGYVASGKPSWDEAREILRRNGREHS